MLIALLLRPSKVKINEVVTYVQNSVKELHCQCHEQISVIHF